MISNLRFKAAFLGLVVAVIAAVPSVQGQDIRSVTPAQLDTLSMIEQEVFSLLNRPLYPHPDSAMSKLNLLLAFETWTSLKKEDTFMPLSDRIDLYAQKAQSFMLNGLFKTIVLSKFVRDDSGVLALTEISIAHLDSSLANYNRLIGYVVDKSVERHRIDSVFTSSVRDSLTAIRDHIQYQRSYDKARAFDVWGTIQRAYTEKLHGDALKKDSLSIANWFYQSAVAAGDLPPYPIEPRPLNPEN